MAALSDSAIMCRSGSAADTEAVAGIVSYHVEQISMERDGTPDVKTVAQIANQVPSRILPARRFSATPGLQPKPYPQYSA
jgi:20S proteasome alpha/beta subunit